MRRSRVFAGSILVVAVFGCSGEGPPPVAVAPVAEARLTGPYLGQPVPGNEPELFAPGVVSTGLHEISINFSPVGDEVFFFATGPTWTPRMILHSRLEDGRWSTPREAVFSDPGRIDLYPFVTRDGNSVFFSSYRSSGERRPLGQQMGIWFVQRMGRGWTEAQKIDFGGDFGGLGTYPSVAANGNLYFNSILDSTASAICVSRLENGRYLAPENLGPAVNSEAGEHHPFIASDESYVLFSSQRTDDTFGDSDLFISRRLEDGSWAAAENLGPPVNTAFADRSPFVTADGNYLFFSSSRPVPDLLPAGFQDYDVLSRGLLSPGNGLQDIYWVSTEAIGLP